MRVIEVAVSEDNVVSGYVVITNPDQRASGRGTVQSIAVEEQTIDHDVVHWG